MFIQFKCVHVLSLIILSRYHIFFFCFRDLNSNLRVSLAPQFHPAEQGTPLATHTAFTLDKPGIISYLNGTIFIILC